MKAIMGQDVITGLVSVDNSLVPKGLYFVRPSGMDNQTLGIQRSLTIFTVRSRSHYDPRCAARMAVAFGRLAKAILHNVTIAHDLSYFL